MYLLTGGGIVKRTCGEADKVNNIGLQRNNHVDVREATAERVIEGWSRPRSGAPGVTSCLLSTELL
jgi:hypothetical protein